MSGDTKKLPWFKLFAEKLRSDSKWRKLTSAQRGIFIDLMVADWVEGGIPESPADAMLECARDAKKRDVETVLGLFTERLPNGKITHKRLDEQRCERIKASKKASKGGIGKAARSASSSAQADSKKGASTAQAVPEQDSSSAQALPDRCLEDATRARTNSRGEDRGQKTEEDKYITSKTDSTSEVPAESPKSVSVEKGFPRPDSEEAAIRLCRGQLIDAPEDFIRQLFAHLESVNWMAGDGVNEIGNFGQYVRKAWLKQKDERGRRESGARNAPNRRAEPEVKRQASGKISTGINYVDENP